MSIVVLGGAGLEGSAIAKNIAESGFTDLVLADYNLEGAKARAQEIMMSTNAAVTAQFVDANDHKSLLNVIKDADAVVNAIGPFYMYLEKILRAVIEAKVPKYVDICDDAEPTKKALSFCDV